MISFIVPIKYDSKNYIYYRALALIDYFSKIVYDVELIILDSSKNKLVYSNSSKVKIVKLNYEKKIYSPAKARNECIHFSTKEFLFFLDVDLSFSDTFVKALLNLIHKEFVKSNKKFIMLPCLYLSKEGTQYFESQSSTQDLLNKFKKSYMIGENSFVERLAVNTSAILLRKKYFIEIGMFDEDFNGHGGEDFELLHRLAANSPHSKKGNDYYLDKVESFPINYTGFRKYMSYYSFEYLFTDLVLVHRWHERKLFNKFYFQRVKNESKLIEKMKTYDNLHKHKIWYAKNNMVDYEQFLKNIVKQSDIEPSKAIGLYKLRSDQNFQRPLSAKIRKLITRPNLFFSDMLNNLKVK